MTRMVKHFVTFLSPGTFVAEQSTRELDSWDVDAAKKLAGKITERYGATPYAFYFTTRARGDDDFESKVIARSGTYYLGGIIKTLKEIELECNKDNDILIQNMRCNHWDKIIRTRKPWSWSQPFEEDDVLLDFEPEN